MSYTPEQIGEQVRIAALAAQAREPGQLAAAISILLDDDNWRAYVDPSDRRKHEWQDFRLFVQGRLGTTPEALIGALNHAPGLAARVADLATAGRGRPWPDGNKDVEPTSLALQPRTRIGGLRNLRKHGHDDLADRAEAGELSVTAARVQAGLEKPRVTIPVDSAEHVIRLLTHSTPRRPTPLFTTAELRQALDELDTET